MYDLLKRHQAAIMDVQHQVHSRATKHEMANALALKANVGDVSKTVQDIANNIEARALDSDVQRMLNDRVPRSDLQYLLANKANIDEVKGMVEGMASQSELGHELHRLSARMDDIRQEMQRRMGTCPSDRDIHDLKLAI